MPTERRYLAQRLLLPLLVGLAAFSSKERSPDLQLTYLCSWALLLVSSVISIRTFRVPWIARILAFAAIIARVLSHLSPDNAGLAMANMVSSAPLLLVAGASAFVVIPRVLLRQIYWTATASVVMSLLQLGGVIWAQDFGSAADWKGAGHVPLLFQPYRPDLLLNMAQWRPDGITHANNLTGQLLLMFFAYAVALYSARSNAVRPALKSVFMIAFAGALSGGKVVLVGIGLVGLVALIVPGSAKGKVVSAGIACLLAYLLGATLYPGVFAYTYNPNLLFANASVRMSNTGLTERSELFASLTRAVSETRFDSFPASEMDPSVVPDEAISGVAQLVPYAAVILPTLVFVGWWQARRIRQLVVRFGSALAYDSTLMAVACVASILGGPFFRTTWFTFFASLALLPLLAPWLRIQAREPRRPEDAATGLGTYSA